MATDVGIFGSESEKRQLMISRMQTLGASGAEKPDVILISTGPRMK